MVRVRTSAFLSLLLAGMAWAQDPLDKATKLNNQALALTQEGRFQDAESLYRSALAIESGNELDRAKIADHLARLYRRQDRYPEAEQAFRRALQWRQKNLPPTSVEIAYSLSNLADVYGIEGRDWEARNLLETAVRILRDFHPDARGFSTIMSNLAVVLSELHEYDQAEDLLRKALNDSERQHGAASREVGIAANNLAQVLRAKNDLQDAAAMYARAVGIFETLGPEGATYLASTLANIGQLLEQQHQIDEAQQTEQRALDLLSSGGNGPLRATILQNLGNMVAGSGNPAGSLPYFAQSLNISEKALGSEHPSTVRLLFDYAAATLRAGQKSLARKLQKRAEEMRARLKSEAPERFTVSLGSLRDAQ
jgi:tetratricopeptide (TPR) repeat protein